MRTVIIIPARYQSSRFPGKPLVDILGIPMIIRVAQICEKAVGKEAVYIATDDVKIIEESKKYGYQSIMTSRNAITGTDRVAEAAKKIDADIYINVQGDEPTLKPENIKNVIKAKHENPHYVINSYYKILPSEDPNSKSIPKVIMNEKQLLIYISRSLIPGSKSNEKIKPEYYKQVCIYAFSKIELEKFLDYGRKSKIEAIEDIEILRFLDLDTKILMVPASETSIAVDEPADLIKVKNYLKKINES